MLRIRRPAVLRMMPLNPPERRSRPCTMAGGLHRHGQLVQLPMQGRNATAYWSTIRG